MRGRIDLMKDQDFTPSSAMKLYAFQRAKLGKKAKDSQVSKLISIRPETISRWKRINGFNKWLEQQISVHLSPIQDVWTMVGTENLMKGDFRYWQELGRKHGFLPMRTESLYKRDDDITETYSRPQSMQL